MKNYKATIIIFIASLIIGLFIATDIKADGKSSFLDVKQYYVAYKERNRLYSELNNLKELYGDAYLKLQNDESANETKSEVLEKVQKKINYNNIILGRSDVEGQGIKIILDDGTSNINKDSTIKQLIHDSDIVGVINDLKNAGAEAISVNGERIISDNYGLCAGSDIDLNGIRIVPPFYFSAIGNEDAMYNYLTLKQTHVKLLEFNESNINITKDDNIKILAYTGKITYKYMSLFIIR